MSDDQPVGHSRKPTQSKIANPADIPSSGLETEVEGTLYGAKNDLESDCQLPPGYATSILALGEGDYEPVVPDDYEPDPSPPGPDYPEVDPEDDRRHRALLDEVKRHLRAFAVDFTLQRETTRKSVEWLANNPHAIRMFASPQHWSLTSDGPRPIRSGMIREVPRISENEAQLKRQAYGNLLRLLVIHATNSNTEIEAKAAQALRLIDESYITFAEEEFVQTGNPLHAWRCFTLCRMKKYSIPGWVLSYFDSCAARLERVVNGERGNLLAESESSTEPVRGALRTALLSSFGFTPGKPGTNAELAIDNNLLMRVTYDTVLEHYLNSGHEQIVYAFEDAANELGMTRASTAAHYYHVKRTLGDL